MSTIGEPGDMSLRGSQKVGAARGSTGLGGGADADQQAGSGSLLPRSSGVAAATDESARSFDDPSGLGHQSGPRSLSYLEGCQTNVKIEADFQKSASLLQIGLAGT
jgi:hypothetical protein